MDFESVLALVEQMRQKRLSLKATLTAPAIDKALKFQPYSKVTIPSFSFSYLYNLTSCICFASRQNMALRIVVKRAGALRSIGRVSTIEPRTSRRHASAAAIPTSNLSDDARNEIQVLEVGPFERTYG